MFVCLLAWLAGHALYGMAPCFRHTGVTFDAENDRAGPGSLRGHFEAARGRLRVCPEWPAMSCMAGNVLYGMASCFGHTGVTFDAENDRPGPGSLRGHFEDARGHIFETEGFVGREATASPPQELYRCEALVYYYL